VKAEQEHQAVPSRGQVFSHHQDFVEKTVHVWPDSRHGAKCLFEIALLAQLLDSLVLECGSLLPLFRQPGCWRQLMFPVDPPASKLARKKAAASCRTPKRFAPATFSARREAAPKLPFLF
jgi:hypothetical protein